MRRLGLHPGMQTAVKRTLRELVRQGVLSREGKRFALLTPPPPAGPSTEHRVERGRGRNDRGFPRRKGPPEPSRPASGAASVKGARGRKGGREVQGTLQIRRAGHGIVRTSEGEEFFVPEFDARKALDNDKVRLQVFEGGPRVEARIVQVAERRRAQAVGIYREGPRGTAVVEPSDDSLPGLIRVPRTQIARDGDVVRVVLGIGQELLGHEGLTGEVAGSLGKPGDPSQEVLSIAFSQGFSDEFPPEAMAEADALPLRIPASAVREEGRRDLRELPLVTIDGEDARDFDDAIHAEPRGQGFKLWVAIADVAQYVREGSALNAEALRRATSVYLPDRVLPMLPERLSNGLCSLRPEEDRLCLVAEIELDAQGERQGFTLYPGVMRSAARCTYTEVQAVLDGQDVPHRTQFKPKFEVLQRLARALHGMRQRRGAIDFDLPELRVEMGEGGQPARMVKRDRLESHRIVEECMLAANEAVASFFQDRGLPTVYRFHGEPDEDKIATFMELAASFGFKLGRKGEVTSKELNDFVQKLAGHPEQRALNQLLLRSMMQAVYSSENVGHYGLAATEYLHFTSPIRRYPDLLVHRLLKAHWARGGRQPSARELEAQAERLEELAVQSSERERAAMLVEREVVSFYAALLVKDRVGEVFLATVAAVTDFGFFVQLDDVWVEGLVKAESVGFGARYDERRLALTYPDGKAIKVGQKLVVRLTSVSVARRQIDFALESLDPEALDAVRAEVASGGGRAGGGAWRSGGRPLRAERGEGGGRAVGGARAPGAGQARAGGRSPLLERIDQLKRERKGGAQRSGATRASKKAPPSKGGGAKKGPSGRGGGGKRGGKRSR